MRSIILAALTVVIVLGMGAICRELNTLTQVIKEKQIILNIGTLELDVEAQKGSVVHLHGDSK